MKFVLTKEICEFILSHKDLFYEMDSETKTFKAHEKMQTGRITFSEFIEFFYKNSHLPIIIEYKKAEYK